MTEEQLAAYLIKMADMGFGLCAWFKYINEDGPGLMHFRDVN